MSNFESYPEPPTPLGRLRILSPTAGIRMSPLQLGAMNFGTAFAERMGAMDKEATFKVLDAFYEAGGRSIDTANNYQNEESETLVGDWLEARGVRDQMVIATKYTSGYKAYDLGATGGANYAGNHKKSMVLSLKDSLRKLKTDYIDIFYLHWFDYTTSVEEVVNALDDVVKSGKVLYLGISDSPAWWVAAANTYAKAHGKNQFVVYQGKWNVMLRDFERDIIPMCKHFGMALAPWGVIGGGKLQSKKQLEARKAAGEKSRASNPQTDTEIKYSEVLSTIAERHGLESPSVIAIAYVMRKTPFVFPIVGGRKVEHLHENIKALSIKLTDSEMQEIESVEPFDVGFPHDFLGKDPHMGPPGPSPVAIQRGTLDYVQQSKAL
ncbi:oxidoreductase with NAD+ or NADP+ as acceptor [Saitozyma sp. JCM 24511]|nr:oxidoreductase with NAD+ or NADP+ as acceptor [Saitozyma sp. JCM 24511]